jgi:hypothetical protein
MQGSVRTRRTGSAEVPPAAPGSASAMLGGGTVLRVAALAIWWRVLTGGSLNPLDGLRLGPDAMLWLRWC